MFSKNLIVVFLFLSIQQAFTLKCKCAGGGNMGSSECTNGECTASSGGKCATAKVTISGNTTSAQGCVPSTMVSYCGQSNTMNQSLGSVAMSMSVAYTCCDDKDLCNTASNLQLWSISFSLVLVSLFYGWKAIV